MSPSAASGAVHTLIGVINAITVLHPIVQVHPDWIALAALVVAVVAAAIAAVSVCWAHSEHVEFLKRLRARARLRVQLTAIGNLAAGTDDPLAVAAEPRRERRRLLSAKVIQQRADIELRHALHRGGDAIADLVKLAAAIPLRAGIGANLDGPAGHIDEPVSRHAGPRIQFDLEAAVGVVRADGDLDREQSGARMLVRGGRLGEEGQIGLRLGVGNYHQRQLRPQPRLCARQVMLEPFDRRRVVWALWAHHLDQQPFEQFDRLAVQRTGSDHMIVGLDIESVDSKR
jgi:hypothetical protein